MVGDLADYDRTFDASIFGDLADRSLERTPDTLTPASWSSLLPLTFRDFAAHSSATPPPER